MSKKEKVKDTLMSLVLFAMLYVLLVMVFILDGAPFHWEFFNEGGEKGSFGSTKIFITIITKRKYIFGMTGKVM